MLHWEEKLTWYLSQSKKSIISENNFINLFNEIDDYLMIIKFSGKEFKK